jgi:hypothetical protein
MNFEDAVIKVLGKLEYQSLSRDQLKKIKIGKRNLERVLGYLEDRNHNLVYPPREHPDRHYAINPDGIDYLSTKRKEKRQEEFNRIVAFTGAILALIAIYTFINDLGLINDTNFCIEYIFLTFAVIAVGPIVAFIIDSYWKGVK